MYKFIYLIFFGPALCFSQKQDTYLRLVDANGKQIIGESFSRGFEKQIQAFTSSAGGKNNTQLSFTMSISGASADLKKALASGDFLQNGLVTVLQAVNNDPNPKPAYTVKMEKIKVVYCAEAMGCNGVTTTTVTLQATRIGWTYYQNNLHGGTLIVSNKYGYDAETGGQWTNF